MIKNSRILLLLSIAIVILIGTIFIINRVKRYENNEALKAIPMDAALIICSDGFNNVYELINDGVEYRDELLNSHAISLFFDFKNRLDSLQIINQDALKHIGSNPFYLSLHAQGKENVKALVLSEFTNKRQENIFRGFIEELGNGTYRLQKRKYNTIPVYTLLNDNNEKYSLAIHQGIVFGSSSHLLVESAIRQLQSDRNLLTNPGFLNVRKTAASTALCNIYFNFSNAPKVLKPILSRSFQNLGESLKDQSDWGELDLDLKSNGILLNGFLAGKEKGVYNHLFVNAQPKRPSIHQVLPSNTRSFISLAFEDGRDLQKRLGNYYESNGLTKAYMNSFSQVNQKIEESFQSTVYEMLNGEIALAYSDFDHNRTENNGILVLEVNSQSIAKDKVSGLFKKGIGHNSGEPVSYFSLDDEVKYPIYRGFKNDAIKLLFQAFLPEVPQNYFAFIDNYWVFANSVQQLEKFIYANILGKTLDKKKVFEDHRSHFSGRENMFLFCETGQLSTFLGKAFEPLISELSGSQREALNQFYGTGLQFSGTGKMIYSTIYIDYKPNRSSEPRTIWQSLLDSTVIIKPVLVENHYSKEKEVLIQDASNAIYLINNKGRVLWKKMLDGPILSEVNQIDYYRNNKLQYLFNTSKKMYLLDRNGNSVANYPITLPSEATNGLAVFDYDKSRNYRIFLATTDRKVLLYDKTGNRISGWDFKRSEGKITLPIQHFRTNNKDYIAFADEKRNYILNRKGQQRVKLKYQFKRNSYSEYFLEGADTDKNTLVTTDDNGNIMRISLNTGEVKKLELKGINGTHAMKAFEYKGKSRFVVSTPESVSQFDFNGKLIFSRDFENEIHLNTDIYQFSANNHKVGVVEKSGGRIFLINSDGDDYKSFPLVGQSRFSIGFLKTSSSRFNLIVGGSNNYLYNYRVE